MLWTWSLIHSMLFRTKTSLVHLLARSLVPSIRSICMSIYLRRYQKSFIIHATSIPLYHTFGEWLKLFIRCMYWTKEFDISCLNMNVSIFSDSERNGTKRKRTNWTNLGSNDSVYRETESEKKKKQKAKEALPSIWNYAVSVLFWSASKSLNGYYVCCQ